MHNRPQHIDVVRTGNDGDDIPVHEPEVLFQAACDQEGNQVGLSRCRPMVMRMLRRLARLVGPPDASTTSLTRVKSGGLRARFFHLSGYVDLEGAWGLEEKQRLGFAQSPAPGCNCTRAAAKAVPNRGPSGGNSLPSTPPHLPH
jgi:hypothetical protein